MFKKKAKKYLSVPTYQDEQAKSEPSIDKTTKHTNYQPSKKISQPAALRTLDGIIQANTPKLTLNQPNMPINSFASQQASINRPTNSQKLAISSVHQKNHLEIKPQRSQTLMRQVVKKPQSSRTQINPSRPINYLQPKINQTVNIQSVNQQTNNNLNSSKPSLISRFGATTISPAIEQKTNQQSAPTSQPTTQTQKPVIKDADFDNYLLEAIDKATSHKQPRVKRKLFRIDHHHKLHYTSYGLIGIASLMVLGYAAYSYLPNIMVKIAAAKAGFSATLPQFRPSGYSINNVAYNSKQIRINYKSNIASLGQFSLYEYSSNINSNTLLTSSIIPQTNGQYNLINYDNLKIYIFNNNQAEWTKDGIIYRVIGNSNINQIESLAASS